MRCLAPSFEVSPHVGGDHQFRHVEPVPPPLVCAALLFTGAVMIALDKRGFLESPVKDAVGTVGLACGLAGFSGLLATWAAGGFRVSIGRLMGVIAFIAVLVRGVMAYVRWMTAG